MSTVRTGKEGEDLAAAYLEGRGMVVMERNYRYERAELDLVCFEPAKPYSAGGTIVFVEVKSRSGTGFGLPEEAVSIVKRRNLTRAAHAFLYERQLENAPCRFDVVSVMFDRSEPVIRHIRNAFTAAD